MSSSDKISSVALTCSDTVDMQVCHLNEALRICTQGHTIALFCKMSRELHNCILRYVFKPKAFRFIKFVNKMRSFLCVSTSE